MCFLTVVIHGLRFVPLQNNTFDRRMHNKAVDAIQKYDKLIEFVLEQHNERKAVLENMSWDASLSLSGISGYRATMTLVSS